MIVLFNSNLYPVKHSDNYEIELVAFVAWITWRVFTTQLHMTPDEECKVQDGIIIDDITNRMRWLLISYKL